MASARKGKDYWIPSTSKARRETITAAWVNDRAFNFSFARVSELLMVCGDLLVVAAISVLLKPEARSSKIRRSKGVRSSELDDRRRAIRGSKVVCLTFVT